MALRTINYTLDVSDISPKATQYGGIQGEDNVTDIIFTFSTALVTALNTAKGSLTLAYRIDAKDGASGFYSSGLLTYNGANNTITFTIPQDLTSVSGTCELHLIISLLDSNNVEQNILYSYPASVKFSASSYGSSPEAAYKREITGALLQAETSATNASDSAGEAATAAGEAANAVSTHNNDSNAHSAAMALKANASDLTAHTGNTANPHGTTKAQVGLGNVDNTSDVNKPVSTAQATAINNAISTAGTNADAKIITHNTSESAHSDIRDTINLPTATASGTSLTLTDVSKGKNFVDITAKGVTTETGTGTKALDNPYTLSGVTPTKVTVGSTDYPITSSALYSLPDGTVDTYNAVSGLETHNIGMLTLDGVTEGDGFYAAFGWNDQASPTVCYMGTVSSLTADRTTTCILCDKLLVKGITAATGKAEGIYKEGSSFFYIFINKSRFTYTYGDSQATVAANIKAYLATNPLHLIYKLATPTTTQHTPQTISQPSLSATITPDYGTVSVTYYRDLASAINLKANMAQEAWITPTLVNLWVNYDTDGTNELAGYFKDTIGFVHLKGRIKSGTIGSTIFILPAGYRPSRLKYFAISSNNLFGQVTISSAGLVTCTVGSNVSVALENITFRAEA